MQKDYRIKIFRKYKNSCKFLLFSDCNKQDPSQTRNRLKNLEFFIL
ncbi:hypothetical protein LEP1GSC029_0092 [Leptospira interrogans str. 2002000626]|uniref:Uncharacterized protein n=1 Tax=Leptospira interrogans str. 2002000626 TaxID=996803 RepID=A0A829D594_LEPIR|nr:hypothetical protein LEP1GSC029_0092 [Leptospira interrogans str. 2002000626]